MNTVSKMTITQLVARHVEIRRIKACIPGLEKEVASSKVKVASPESIGYKATIANLQLRDAEKKLADAEASLLPLPDNSSSSRFAAFQAEYILASEDIEIKRAELEITLDLEKESISKGAWKFSSGVAKDNSIIKALKTQIAFLDNEKEILDKRNVTTTEVLTQIRLMEAQEESLLAWIYANGKKPDFVEEDEAADLSALQADCERIYRSKEAGPDEEPALEEWGTPLSAEDRIRHLKAELQPAIEIREPEYQPSTNGRGSKAQQELFARFTAAAKARRLAASV